MRTPLFFFRLQKSARRTGLAGFTPVMAGVAVVAGALFWLTGSPAPSALPESAKQQPSPIEAASETGPPDKREDRMPAAVIAEQRGTVGADLGTLPPFEVSPLRSIDGTSFKHGEDVVRLAGVEGPGAGDVCRDDEIRWSCGLQARAALHNLVAGRPLACRPRKTLSEGMIAADCELPPKANLPTGDLARLLVRQGWARPDASANAGLGDAAAQAQRDRAGLWRGNWTIIPTER